MSKRAEEAALEAYPRKCTSWVWGQFKDSDSYQRERKACQKGYEQAEKDTIERAVAWLKEHANDYIVDLTPTYPDAPSDIIIGGKCWDDLKEYMEDE